MDGRFKEQFEAALTQWSAVVDPESWGTDEQAQQEQAALMGLIGGPAGEE